MILSLGWRNLAFFICMLKLKSMLLIDLKGGV